MQKKKTRKNKISQNSTTGPFHAAGGGEVRRV